MTKLPGEFSLIEKYFAPLAADGAYGLKDDAAQVSPTAGHKLVVTQDACAEGIHFFPDDPPELIAKKALRVNLSDIAAKGAVPRFASLALGLGEGVDEGWVAGFASGLGEDLELFGVALTGGDTFRTGSGSVISITLIGEIPDRKYTTRSGGQAGDYLFVTGTIGDAALGLQVRLGNLKNLSPIHVDFLVSRYLCPEPRTGLTELLQTHATAAMDISDGLVGDLEKLCAASGVGAELELLQIPLSPAAKTAIESESHYLKTAVTGGDDYEILFSVPAARVDAFIHASHGVGVELTEIGKLTGSPGVVAIDENGNPVRFEQGGYDHSGAR